MKNSKLRLLLAALPLCLTFQSQAQIHKGTTFIGGNIGLSTSSTESANPSMSIENKDFNFAVNPKIGFYLCNSIALGVSLNFSTDNSKSTNFFNSYYTKQDQNTNMYGASLFGRYNNALSKRFSFFLEVGAGYGRSIGKYKQTTTQFDPPGTSNVTRVTSNVISAYAVPGLIYFVNPKFGIEATYGSIRYAYSNQDKNTAGPSTFKSNNLNFNLGISTFTLGANYYFGHKPRKIQTESED